MRALLKFVTEEWMTYRRWRFVRWSTATRPTLTGRFTMTTKLPAAVDPSVDPLVENGVFYPETDGVPLPDGEFQYPLFHTVVMPLRHHFRNRPHARVNGNTFIYYEEGNPARWISPDCYVAFDVDVSLIEYHNTYRVWAIGKPPDFVMEIGSKSTARRDMREKRALYAKLGVGEYWRYDATDDSAFYGEPLIGEHLLDGAYERLPLSPMPDGIWGHSPTLGLDLHWDAGRLWFYDSETGERLLSYDDQAEALEEVEDALQESEAAHRATEVARRREAAAHRATEVARRREAAARQAAEVALRESEAARQREVVELQAQLRRLRAQQGE